MSLHPCIKKGNVAVITGGASGIGLAFAKTLVSHAMRVVLADHNEADLKQAVENFQRDSADVLAVKTDVSNLGEMENLREVAWKKFGRVDLLHLNAAVSPSTSPSDHMDAWRKIIDTNMWGVINGFHAFVPAMLQDRQRSDRGAIVVTGSKQGITCPPGNAAYNVSKAAVKTATEQLAHQLRNEGDTISAHLLVPGYTWTGLTNRGQADKPDEAWTAQQVVDYLLPRMAKGDFYIVCPDNTVTEVLDKARMEWSLGDVVENRPALSRWHKDHEKTFAAHIKDRTGN